MADRNCHLVEVALRDTRNKRYIEALDRLVVLPEPGDKEGLRQAVDDMRLFKEFLEQQVPEVFGPGMEIFNEHSSKIVARFKGEME